MGENALAVRDVAAVVEQVVIHGDLAKLSPGDRVAYYQRVCESLGLNALTKPFDYITLNGKLTLYAKRDATDQLRKIHNVSVVIVGRDRLDDVYVVTARATLPNGRTDESVGAVSIGGLKGDNLANALMKAETKAKRRVTLSIVGLGMLDETEVGTIPDAIRMPVEQAHAELEVSEPERPPEPPRVVAVGHAAKREGPPVPFAMPVNQATGRPYTESELRLRYRELVDKAAALGLAHRQLAADAPLGAVIETARGLHREIQAAELAIPAGGA